MITRTPALDPNVEFTVDVPIVKATIDEKTGKRYIKGCASGVAEDRDGERVSRTAIKGMVRDVTSGDVRLTATHQHDWWSDIGKVVEATHDPDTDEFMITTELPPEGTDPLADKGWVIANTRRVGFSIGGKLLKSYFERNELGKKRKVLDAIKLRHVALTESPSYATSFAQAVAKTWDGEDPDDSEFTLHDDVAKGGATGGWASGDSDSGGGNTSRDSVGSGQRNAGTKPEKGKGMNVQDDGSNTDDDDDGDDAKDLPKAPDERHLACPNCGHEFAADLPTEPGDQQPDNDNPDDEDDAQDQTGKSTEKTMSLSTSLDALRDLEKQEEVAKTDPEPEVTKTETASDDVAKALGGRLDSVEETIGEAFTLIAKSFERLQEQLAAMPQGRKSIARIPEGGLPPSVGHAGGTVEKTVEQQVDEAPDAVTALKAVNKARYGIE